jgi:BioD-like phosphotransacetylase family protein
MIMEGAQDLFVGGMLGLPVYRLAALLKARLLVVNRWETDLDSDTMIAVNHYMGKHFAGVIFNNVPRTKVDYLERLVKPMLNREGIEVFGIIPRDKVLSSVSAREVSEVLGGEVLCCEEHLDRLAEQFMVGAMNIDKSYEYFKKTKNKIVIIGGDRADVQLAALETDTAAVILTGGLFPNDIILGKADEEGIPLIRVKGDTFKVVERLEEAMGTLRLDNERKVKRGVDLIRKKIDFKLLEKQLA